MPGEIPGFLLFLCADDVIIDKIIVNQFLKSGLQSEKISLYYLKIKIYRRPVYDRNRDAAY